MLVLVVGPSGVGKDTLLDGARIALADDRGVLFAQRQITRPAAAGGEAHIPIGESEFAAREAAGAFALSWRAHGLAYGVGVEIDSQLAAGLRVVVNVSRQVLNIARHRYGAIRVVSVTADPRVLAKRLRSRARETEAEIAARLARAAAVEVAGDDVVIVRNEGEPQEGVAQLVAAIRR